MEIYYFTDNFWHEYYNVRKVKRRKEAICIIEFIYTNKKITK